MTAWISSEATVGATLAERLLCMGIAAKTRKVNCASFIYRQKLRSQSQLACARE